MMAADQFTGQGIIPLACGHNRTLPMADAIMAAQLGGLIHCPECSAQAGEQVRARIRRGVMMPAPDWQAFYREAARSALADYDRRRFTFNGDPALFYAEMAGALAQSIRLWLEECDQ